LVNHTRNNEKLERNNGMSKMTEQLKSVEKQRFYDKQMMKTFKKYNITKMRADIELQRIKNDELIEKLLENERK